MDHVATIFSSLCHERPCTLLMDASLTSPAHTRAIYQPELRLTMDKQTGSPNTNTKNIYVSPIIFLLQVFPSVCQILGSYCLVSIKCGILRLRELFPKMFLFSKVWNPSVKKYCLQKCSSFLSLLLVRSCLLRSSFL